MAEWLTQTSFPPGPSSPTAFQSQNYGILLLKHYSDPSIISFFTLGSSVQMPWFLAWVIATVSKGFWCPLFCPSVLYCKVWPHSFQRERMKYHLPLPQTSSFSSIQSFSRVQLFATPWTAARQASLSITSSWGLPKLVSIESVMPSNHLILCCPLLLPPSIFPRIRVFSNESVLCIRWPKYWSFSFRISLSNEYSGLISFRMDWLDLLLSKGLSRVFSNTTVQKHQFFGVQLSL